MNKGLSSKTLLRRVCKLLVCIAHYSDVIKGAQRSEKHNVLSANPTDQPYDDCVMRNMAPVDGRLFCVEFLS